MQHVDRQQGVIVSQRQKNVLELKKRQVASWQFRADGPPWPEGQASLVEARWEEVRLEEVCQAARAKAAPCTEHVTRMSCSQQQVVWSADIWSLLWLKNDKFVAHQSLWPRRKHFTILAADQMNSSEPINLRSRRIKKSVWKRKVLLYAQMSDLRLCRPASFSSSAAIQSASILNYSLKNRQRPGSRSKTVQCWFQRRPLL